MLMHEQADTAILAPSLPAVNQHERMRDADSTQTDRCEVSITYHASLRACVMSQCLGSRGVQRLLDPEQASTHLFLNEIHWRLGV